MLERVLILFLLALAIAAGWGLLRLWRGAKLRGLRGEAPLAGLVPMGRPAVVAFSTATCAECRARQAPALARLAAALGDAVTVRSLSALDHPDLIRRIGILTVPATLVLDREGRVRELNLGYASDERLREQLLTIDDYQ
ncbi:MAG: TlpA family protein disulfide reductase [Roseiflexaceae bacterium]